MISKTAFESLPHNCGTPNCNYKRVKNEEYFRARALGLDPETHLFASNKTKARRERRRQAARDMKQANGQ